VAELYNIAAAEAVLTRTILWCQLLQEQAHRLLQFPINNFDQPNIREKTAQGKTKDGNSQAQISHLTCPWIVAQ
jgi:hypothetical protein